MTSLVVQCGRSLRVNATSKWYFRRDGGDSSKGKKKKSSKREVSQDQSWKLPFETGMGSLIITHCWDLALLERSCSSSTTMARWLCAFWEQSWKCCLHWMTWTIKLGEFPYPTHSLFHLWPALLIIHVHHPRRSCRWPSNKPQCWRDRLKLVARSSHFYIKTFQCSVFWFGFNQFLLLMAIKM